MAEIPGRTRTALRLPRVGEGRIGKLAFSAIDTAGFRFASLTEFDDPQFLPGAVKYGDVAGLLALSAGSEVWLSGEKELPKLTAASWKAAGAGAPPTLFAGEASAKANDAVKWLSR